MNETGARLGEPKAIKETDVMIIMRRLENCRWVAQEIRERAGNLHYPVYEQSKPTGKTEPCTIGEQLIDSLDVLHTTLSIGLSSLVEFN